MKSHNWNIIAFWGSILIFLWVAIPAHAIEVHNFDCKNCHKVGVSYTELGNSATNVCLECHKDNPPSVTMLDGSSATPTGLFAPTDASNAMGSYPSGLSEGSGAGAQTSHMWAGRDVVEAAGAQAPSSRVFYGRYGISTGKLTCQRCHDPHSRDATNTKILRLGTNGKEQMCLDCHKPWNLDNTDHGLLTHPIVSDYQAVYDAAPDDYRSPAQVAAAQGGVTLVEGGVSCSSCHGVHFTDSDGTTTDGPAQALSEGDGKLLRADGPEGTDPSALCQACHAYKEHGSGTETVGCLVCHSGHSYNGGTPNYFVLRSTTETATYGAVSSLSYTDLASDLGGTSSTAQLWAGSDGSANGYCERCHGELTSMPGSTRVHIEGEDCNGCHGHNAAGNDYAFGANCTDCHGWPPATTTAGGPDGYAFVSGSRDYSGDANYKPENTTAHLTHAGSVDGYGLACAHCHDDDFATTHNDGNFQNVFSGASAHSVTSAGGLLSPNYDKTGDGTCSNVYCHSNGGARNASGTKVLSDYTTHTVSWANTTISSCAACHGNDTATMTSLGNSSAHTAHLDAGYACVICHEQTALDADNLVSGVESGLHLNGAADVLFDNGYELSTGNALGAGSYGTDGTCAVYCHSDGLGTTTTPDWDDPASGACGTCHGNAPESGSHARHVSDESGPQLACSACHPTNSDDATHAEHVDGKIDVTDGICDSCHAVDEGETVPVWGNAGTLDCLTCHGGATLSVIDGQTAPDKSLATGRGHNRSSADGPYPVSGNAAAARACLDCHNGSAPGHFDGISGNNARVIEGGAFPADYSVGRNGFCAACHAAILTHQSKDCVACHDPHGTANIEMIYRAQSAQNGKDASGSGAFSGDVVFTARTGADSFDELDDGAGANADDICATCHSSANGISHNNREVTGLHSAGDMRGTDCSQCHSHAKTFSPVGTACNQCHGNPPTSGAHGAHALVTLHTDEEDLSDCEACHTGAASYSYDPAGDRSGGYNHSDSAGRKTVLTSAVGYDEATGTCATACHLSSEADGAWDDADGLACHACHYYAANPTSAGNQAYTDPQGAALPLSSRHNAHFDAGTQCADCHGTLEAQGPGLDHNNSKDAASDADKIRYQGYEYLNPTGTDVMVDDSAFNQGGGSTWLNSAVNDDGGNTCANLDCHNPSGTSYKADWDVDTADCTLCHSATDPATGAHTKHLGGRDPMYGGNLVCTTCHVDNGTDSAHRSGSVELNQAAEPTCNSCHLGHQSSNYSCLDCHPMVDGDISRDVSIMWQQTELISGACWVCHDSSPATKAHTLHLSGTSGPAIGTNCSACHQSNTNNSSMSGMPTHMNGTLTFVNRATPASPHEVVSGAIHQPANDGVDSCDNCHGGNTAGNLAKDAWIAGSAVTCASCHGQYGTASSAADGSGVNAPTRAGSFDSVGHGRTSGDYPPAQQCADCHDSTSAHISGVLDDADRLSVSTGGYDFSVAGEKNAYCQDCHANLGGMAAHYDNTRTSGGSSTDALYCATCHDPHGQSGQDAMIRGTIGGRSVTGFTDRSVRGSYYTSAAELGGGNYGVCQVCHDGAEVAYFNRAAEDDAGHNPGSACTGCHVHDSGETAFEADCMGCHGGGDAAENFENFWPDIDSKDPVDWPNRAGAHAQHVISIGDIINGGGPGSATTADKNQSCVFCHPQGAHSGDQAAAPADTYRDGQAGNDDVGDYYIHLLDDPSNPGSQFPLDTEGSFVPYNYAERFNESISHGTCSNIACHSSAPFTPQWYGDDQAPGQIVDLAAATHDTRETHVDGVTDQPGTVLLTWTAPGDNGHFNGTAYEYEVYYSTAGQITEANVDSAIRAGGAPPVRREGTAQEMVVDGLEPGTNYWFAVRTQDEPHYKDTNGDGILETFVREGNTSLLAATGSATQAHSDDVPPIFWGIDSAMSHDTGDAINLSWGAARDHTLPITYRVYWSDYSLKTHLARGGTLPLPGSTAYSGGVESTGYGVDAGGGAPIEGGTDYTIYVSTTGALTYQVKGLNPGVLYNFLTRAEDGAATPNVDDNLVVSMALASSLPQEPERTELYLLNGASGMTLQVDPTNPDWGGVSSSSISLLGTDSVTFTAGTELDGLISRETWLQGISMDIHVTNGDRRLPQSFQVQFGHDNGTGTFTAIGSTVDVGLGRRASRVMKVSLSANQGLIPADVRLMVRFTRTTTSGSTSSINLAWGDDRNKGQLLINAQPVNHAPSAPVVHSLSRDPGGYVQVTWDPSNDNDNGNGGQTLHYDIFASCDGGASWPYVLGHDLTDADAATGVSWDTVGDGLDRFGGGQYNCQVKVEASDGYLFETSPGNNTWLSHTASSPASISLDNRYDDEAPAAVNIHHVETRPKQGTTYLEWIAVGNDGYNHGTRAAYYDIRYRKTADGSLEEATWDDAATYQAEGEPVPNFSGYGESFELVGMTPDTEHTLGMKACDAGPDDIPYTADDNCSPLSNVVSHMSGQYACGVCHSTPPDDPATGGTHMEHGFTEEDCAKCHGEAVLTYDRRHYDGVINIGWARNSDGSRAPLAELQNGSGGAGVTVTQTVDGSPFDIYVDEDGAGGYNAGATYDPSFPLQNTDSGTCINFGAVNASGCHGPFEPKWQSDTVGERVEPSCADCHGSKDMTEYDDITNETGRLTDPYGRQWDEVDISKTQINGFYQPSDQVEASPPIDNHNLGGKDTRYTGAHLRHLNASFRFAKGDSCRLCHKGVMEAGLHANSEVDVVFDVAADLSETEQAFVDEAPVGDGKGISCGNLNNIYCHDTNARWAEPGAKCNECHGMTGKAYDPVGDVTEIGHTMGTVGNVVPCTYCHLEGHPQSPDGITPGDPDALLINNNPAIGINYRSGGIHLKRTYPWGTYDTLAEICWGCHDQDRDGNLNGPGDINEFGTNNKSATGNSPYDYGYLNQSSWVGAVWSSGYGQGPGDPFYYKRGKIQSTHSTDPTGTSKVTWNPDRGRYDEDLDDVANIRCSNCHDVHNLNKAPGDTMTGVPYLRGTWMGNPYEEDGAPWAGRTYFEPQDGAIDYTFGAVPRGGAEYDQLGGFYIDQNNALPGTGSDANPTPSRYPTSGWTLKSSAGLCTLCHGTNVDTMDQRTPKMDPVEGDLWLGTNGHSNSALGGTFANGANIFDYSHGRPAPVEYNWGGGRPKDKNHFPILVPDMAFLYQGEIVLAGGGYRGQDSNTGMYNPKVTAEQPYAYNGYDWGASVDGTTTDQMYHQFSCSKCHNPHASRLPKLMITNCLDIRHNTWDDNQSTPYLQDDYTASALTNVDGGMPAAYYAAAQNCHRFDGRRSTSDLRGGWNKVTPWAYTDYGTGTEEERKGAHDPAYSTRSGN